MTSSTNNITTHSQNDLEQQSPVTQLGNCMGRSWQKITDQITNIANGSVDFTKRDKNVLLACALFIIAGTLLIGFGDYCLNDSSPSARCHTGKRGRETITSDKENGGIMIGLGSAMIVTGILVTVCVCYSARSRT